MIFTNHAPINLENAELIARLNEQGDFDINNKQIFKGKQFHVVSEYCPPGDCIGRHKHFTYLFGARSLDEVKAWLREKATEMQSDPDNWCVPTEYHRQIQVAPWAGPLLAKLGDFGIEA